jgi:CRISPR-associated protein Cas2
MPLVMVTTTDVSDRFRGFLCSTMLEVATGVYVAPRMNAAVRERVWGVLRDWHQKAPQGCLVMVWRDLDCTGGIGVAHLGTARRELIECDGTYLTRRSRQTRKGSLKTR